MRTTVLSAAAFAMGAILTPVAATADATYHSTHILLSPAPGTSSGSGFVENIHPNGPQVYAHEQYHLQHAVPRTEYTVTLHIYGPDTTCSQAVPVDLEAAVLTTNAVGNASGSHVFTPADAAALPKGVPLGIIWTISADGGTSYASGCESIVLD
jgi:hypothetical protein